MAAAAVTGTVTATYTYDAYGKVTKTTGTATTPLRYTGGYADTETGLTYLINRYYDPATAQFLTVDPLQNITRAPYTYAAGNPLRYVDPSGLVTITPLGCWNLSAGLLFGASGQVCPVVVAVDDQTGEITLGTTETAGGNIQTPTLGGSVTSQLSDARSVDQLKGWFGEGGLSVELGAGVTGGAFGGKCDGAPGGAVVGGELGVGLGLSPGAEVHGGGSYTWAQTWFHW